MALFSKPPAKKPESPKPEPRVRPAAARARPPSARAVLSEVSAPPRPATPQRVAAPANAAAANANVIEWTPAPPAIELASASAGLCAVLENAALLFASGHAPQAREVLTDGVENDPDARGSLLTWLALFDLLQRAGDRAAFDALALKFVVRFERSPPAWEELPARRNARRASAGAFVSITGKLTAGSATQLDALKRLRAQEGASARLDLHTVTGYDDIGARLLADALCEARRLRLALSIEHAGNLRDALESAVNEGRNGGEGAWLLLLELLQWQGDQAAFDDRAVEYAVTFELSPPSWEGVPTVAAPPCDADSAPADADALPWCGEITGAAAQALPELLQFGQQRHNVLLDFSRVERIDFVSAGGLVNSLSRLDAQGKTVKIVGASAIVRALLLLVGVAPDRLVRKAA